MLPLQGETGHANAQDLRSLSSADFRLHEGVPRWTLGRQTHEAEVGVVEMIHYHGTPVTPRSVLYELAGRNFCVSFSDPRDVAICHQIGQSVMLDNGAFSFWKRGLATDWVGYMAWVEPWLDCHTTWAVIPDVIDGSEAENDRLICEWYAVMGSFRQAAPVWHLHESLERLERLVGGFERVCFGSSGVFSKVNSPAWKNRVNEAFNRICRGGRTPAWIHMLRGMSLSGSQYPFASVDSTDIARNHEQTVGLALKMATKWDAQQCAIRWEHASVSRQLVGVEP